MSKNRLDLTTEVLPTLQKLDELIEGKIRGQVDAAIAAARGMLAGSGEPFGWRFIDLSSTDVPDGIRSGGVFVLPGGSAPPAHSHPNSIQHMRVLSGRADVELRSAVQEAADQARFTIGEHRPWVVIPRGVVHGFELSTAQDLVVLSFHTVTQTELLEVGSAGERTYMSDEEFQRVRGTS